MPSFVDGWDVAIPYQLWTCGPDSCGPVNLQGATCVALTGYGTGDTPLTFTGILTVVDATCGYVSYAPSSGDLSQAHGLYKVRFRIRDAAGLVSFCPQDEPELWTVRRI